MIPEPDLVSTRLNDTEKMKQLDCCGIKKSYINTQNNDKQNFAK